MNLKAFTFLCILWWDILLWKCHIIWCSISCSCSTHKSTDPIQSSNQDPHFQLNQDSLLWPRSEFVCKSTKPQPNWNINVALSVESHAAENPDCPQKSTTVLFWHVSCNLRKQREQPWKRNQQTWCCVCEKLSAPTVTFTSFSHLVCSNYLVWQLSTKSNLKLFLFQAIFPLRLECDAPRSTSPFVSLAHLAFST